MNKEAEQIQDLNKIVAVIPENAPGKPPKAFKTKKAVSVFCCMRYSEGLKCPELLRTKITPEGDVYIIPFPVARKGFNDLHISNHGSGKFHWTCCGNHIQPLYGKQDFPAALKLWLKFKCPSCYCFRKSKALNDAETNDILLHIAQYLPVRFDAVIASQDLVKNSFYRLYGKDLKK